jgi:hypothetical protein
MPEIMNTDFLSAAAAEELQREQPPKQPTG